MHTERMQIGQGGRLRIARVQGDLRLVGQEGSEVRILVPDASALTVAHQGNDIEVTCRGGCLVFLPAGCATSIDQVTGDVRVGGLAVSLDIDTVGGDLNLRDMAAVSVARVGGDLVARRAGGRLQAAAIAGEARLEGLRSDITLESVGGDVLLRQAHGSVNLTGGGDVRLEFAPAPGTHSTIRAGGDLECILPDEASVEIVASAGGDLRLPIGADGAPGETQRQVHLGAGEAQLQLHAGGDLRVMWPGEAGRRNNIDVFLEEMDTKVRTEVEKAMAAASSSLRGLDSLPRHEEIARQVEGSLRNAGVRETAPPAAPAGRTRTPAHGGPGEAESPEQMAILNMLQTGKINAQQAETLLRALEGGL